MADIILAELSGQAWLVGGESYIDDLLANTLAPNVTIELIACESKSDVNALWVQHGGDAGGGPPWIIHPAIVRRVRGTSPDYAVFFAQWSAALDNDAMVVLGAASRQAAQFPEAPVLIAEYLDPEGPQTIADLSRLRTQLIEEKLAGHGVARGRFQRIGRDVASVPGMGQESQRIDVIVLVG